jgi:hypothetical protein
MRRLFGRRTRRGQSLVEFALILPVIMFLFLGMVEMGFAVNHNTSIVTATRQGARVGASLGNGSSIHHCNDLTNAGTVDALIIAAVEGVLVSPGSPVVVQQVTEIDIFEVDELGAKTGKTNPWTSSVDSFGNPTGDPVPGSLTGQKLYFHAGTGTYPASGRCGAAPAHGIGVTITYNYRFLTPLGSFLKLFGPLFNNGQITMSDQTIMALEPPSP